MGLAMLGDTISPARMTSIEKSMINEFMDLVRLFWFTAMTGCFCEKEIIALYC